MWGNGAAGKSLRFFCCSATFIVTANARAENTAEEAEALFRSSYRYSTSTASQDIAAWRRRKSAPMAPDKLSPEARKLYGMIYADPCEWVGGTDFLKRLNERKLTAAETAALVELVYATPKREVDAAAARFTAADKAFADGYVLRAKTNHALSSLELAAALRRGMTAGRGFARGMAPLPAATADGLSRGQADRLGSQTLIDGESPESNPEWRQAYRDARRYFDSAETPSKSAKPEDALGAWKKSAQELMLSYATHLTRESLRRLVESGSPLVVGNSRPLTLDEVNRLSIQGKLSVGGGLQFTFVPGPLQVRGIAHFDPTLSLPRIVTPPTARSEELHLESALIRAAMASIESLAQNLDSATSWEKVDILVGGFERLEKSLKTEGQRDLVEMHRIRQFGVGNTPELAALISTWDPKKIARAEEAAMKADKPFYTPKPNPVAEGADAKTPEVEVTDERVQHFATGSRPPPGIVGIDDFERRARTELFAVTHGPKASQKPTVFDFGHDVLQTDGLPTVSVPEQSNKELAYTVGASTTIEGLPGRPLIVPMPAGTDIAALRVTNEAGVVLKAGTDFQLHRTPEGFLVLEAKKKANLQWQADFAPLPEREFPDKLANIPAKKLEKLAQSLRASGLPELAQAIEMTVEATAAAHRPFSAADLARIVQIMSVYTFETSPSDKPTRNQPYLWAAGARSHGRLRLQCSTASVLLAQMFRQIFAGDKEVRVGLRSGYLYRGKGKISAMDLHERTVVTVGDSGPIVFDGTPTQTDPHMASEVAQRAAMLFSDPTLPELGFEPLRRDATRRLRETRARLHEALSKNRLPPSSRHPVRQAFLLGEVTTLLMAGEISTERAREMLLATYTESEIRFHDVRSALNFLADRAEQVSTDWERLRRNNRNLDVPATVGIATNAMLNAIRKESREIAPLDIPGFDCLQFLGRF